MSLPPFPAEYRASGLLLHVTSLPSRYGIGDLGPAAVAWVDRLHETGQTWWQALPLGPTGYGDSPYQSLSAFAGNPLLISLDLLIEDGWLSDAEARKGPISQPGSIDFPTVIAHRRAIWPRLLDHFDTVSHPGTRERFDR